MIVGVIGFKDTRTFKESELDELKQLLNRIYKHYRQKINLLNSRLGYVKINSKLYHEIQKELNYTLERWSEIVKKLGVIPIALGKVRIKGNDSTFIWMHDEEKIMRV